jgi:hypothetical protein
VALVTTLLQNENNPSVKQLKKNIRGWLQMVLQADDFFHLEAGHTIYLRARFMKETVLHWAQQAKQDLQQQGLEDPLGNDGGSSKKRGATALEPQGEGGKGLSHQTGVQRKHQQQHGHHEHQNMEGEAVREAGEKKKK